MTTETVIKKTCEQCRNDGYKTLCASAASAFSAAVADCDTQSLAPCVKAFVAGNPVAHQWLDPDPA